MIIGTTADGDNRRRQTEPRQNSPAIHTDGAVVGNPDSFYSTGFHCRAACIVRRAEHRSLTDRVMQQAEPLRGGDRFNRRGNEAWRHPQVTAQEISRVDNAREFNRSETDKTFAAKSRHLMYALEPQRERT